MGGEGGPGTNPEQLFAVGYAACFQSTLLSVARGRKLDASDSTITARVGIGPAGHGGFGLTVARLARAAPVAGRGRRSDASSPRALPVLERHAGQRRRHARRRRSRIGPEGRVSPSVRVKSEPIPSGTPGLVTRPE